MKNIKEKRRLRLKYSIRKKIFGTQDRPRLSVFRSNRRIYAQIIDDTKAHTLVSASSMEIDSTRSYNVEISRAVGKLIAEKAKSVGISKIVFDRNGYLYHGNVKALAEGAREGGLNF
ncbi:MAG: 50S ribosomal protein L18 [Microscillaceae bacterium]|nr:50S ribosomal protein L18 [Microscillaceae bacterium]MDW8461823.1 50S ribosomal protein L18 [Cytophagales bacterium]